MDYQCPNCGADTTDERWPITCADGVIRECGCTDCWEAECARDYAALLMVCAAFCDEEGKE